MLLYEVENSLNSLDKSMVSPSLSFVRLGEDAAVNLDKYIRVEHNKVHNAIGVIPIIV